MKAGKIKNYLVGKTLGYGGQGFVKLGQHIDTGEAVALKILPKDKQADPYHKDLMVMCRLKEVSSLQHRHIVKIKKIMPDTEYRKKSGSTVRVAVIVQEYAENGCLHEMLARSDAFGDTLARTYFHMLIKCMEICHQVGIFHRDLKPENMLLGRDFELKVCDFGLASVHNVQQKFTKAANSTPLGTPGYTAPEVEACCRDSNAWYDPALADIWSAGCILFALLTRCQLFGGSTDPASTELRRLRADKERFWQEKSQHFQGFVTYHSINLLRGMLAVSPSERYSLQDILADPWFNGPILSPEVLYKEMERRKSLLLQSFSPPYPVFSPSPYHPVHQAVDPFACDAVLYRTAVGGDRRSEVHQRDGEGGEEERRQSKESEEEQTLQQLLRQQAPYSHFFTAFNSKEEALREVEQALRQLDVTNLKVKLEEGKIEGKVIFDGGSEVIAKIRVLEAKPQQCHSQAILVTRRMGSVLDFHEFYEALVEELASSSASAGASFSSSFS